MLDKGRATEVIYLELCKGLDTVPLNILVSKLEGHGFDGWVVQRIKNWLDGCIQKVIVNGSMSRWRSVMSGVPQDSVLGIVLFNNFINDMVGKFVDDTKLSREVETSKERNAVQKNLGRFEEWSSVNLGKFSKPKYKIQHLC